MFTTFLVEPLYNFLVFLLNNVPFADLGVSVIILTILVRIIIFPISKSAIKSQIKMKQFQKPLKEIQKKYKNDRQKMAEEMMKLYRDNNIKPFSSILLILLQLPIILALYFVFYKEGLPIINPDLLYSFMQIPSDISPKLLGLIDVTSKSIILAVAVFATQFVQASIMFKKNEELEEGVEKDNEPNIMEDMMNKMQVQIKYVLPILMGIFSYYLGAIVALYFTTSNIFSIFQEIYIKNKIIKQTKNQSFKK